MKIVRYLSLTAAVGLIGAFDAGPAFAACTQTGFYRDNINMTAAVIATGDITDRTINSTGCNVGIFYGPGTSGTVDNVDVYGANYFGILVVGNLVDSGGNETSPSATSVDVTNSAIEESAKTRSTVRSTALRSTTAPARPVPAQPARSRTTPFRSTRRAGSQ
jgi:hypothetical protein